MCPVTRGRRTFCVVLLVLWMVGLAKVILTGDRCGGRELAMLCMMLLILGLLADSPTMGEAMGNTPLETDGAVALATSFSTTGDVVFFRFATASLRVTPVRSRPFTFNRMSPVAGGRGADQSAENMLP